MAGMLKLPCELVVHILRQLDSVDDLLPARLACRHINDSFLQNSTVVVDIIKNSIPSAAIPDAVAAFRLFHGVLTFDRSKPVLRDLYDRPERLEQHLHDMTFAEILGFEKRHRTVREFVAKYSSTAAGLLNIPRSTLSNEEELRFCRAFYRFDLLCAFLWLHELSGPAQMGLKNANDYILARYPPWEKEQLASVHDFLETTFYKEIPETLTHEISTIDMIIYNYDHENPWLQSRLARGIEYIYDLLHAAQNDRSVLLQGREGDVYDTTLSEILCSESDWDDDGPNKPLQEYSSAELQALDPRQTSTDTNRGPFEAWYQAHRTLWPDTFVMHEEHSNLRARAYVFWDVERIAQNDVSAGPTVSHTITNKQS